MSRSVLITGATAGIGKQTMYDLLELGYTLYVAGRSEEKGKELIEEVQRKGYSITYYLCDVSSFNSIRVFVEKFKQDQAKLDILINNAGVLLINRFENDTGIELSFATNHLGQFLLTNLLLDLLKTSEQGRVINVSSGVHSRVKQFIPENYNTDKYSGFNRYSETKLCNILHMHALVKRLEGTKVTVNALHPGSVASEFAKNNGLIAKIAMTLIRPMKVNLKKGAATSVYLASSDDVKEITGKYFYKKKIQELHGLAMDDKLAERLWTLSEKLVN